MPASKSSKKRKRALPEIPERLPHSVVDNHTHIAPDPVLPDGSAPVQNLTEDGGLRPPVLLATMLDGMKRSGIRAAISSGCEVPMLEFTRDLARNHEEFWAALAIHPNEAAMHAGVREVGPDGLPPRVEPQHEQYSLDAAIELVADYCRDDAVVAVGETGLDYFRTGPEGIEAQKRSFRDHIALAKELGKPLQIHDRDAHADVVDVLLSDGAPEKTVFHCFSGDVQLAEICREHGWYASFAGPLTYPVNEDLQQAFDVLPDELVLAETDAPYLTPVPFRGRPNAVWGVAYTVMYMAQRRGADLDEWCAQIDANTAEVYGI